MKILTGTTELKKKKKHKETKDIDAIMTFAIVRKDRNIILKLKSS